MKIKPGEFFCFLARLVVGGVLLYAGFLKAAGPSAEFAAILQAYKLFPAPLIIPLSIGVPYVEMWVGLFVLTGFFTRPASIAAVLLFISFLVVLLSSIFRGIDLTSCGCFGADSFSPRHTLMLDVVLLALSLSIFRLSKLPPIISLDRSIP